MASILIVDDERGLLEMLEIVLTRSGYEVLTSDTEEGGLALFKEKHPDLALLDLRLGGIGGLEVLKQFKQIDPLVPVIVITAYSTWDNAVEAMRKGAYDYIQKGSADPSEIELVVERALKYQDTARENKRLRSELQDKYSFNNMIGKAHSMEQVFDLIDTVADSRATVLVTGESGTGKELVARALHYNSARRTAPFIRLNCAALPKDLMESELFGHEKGAFTGAIKQTRGRFEMADGGTLLLDEISEIDPSLQAKLLRVLQEREFERIGSTQTIKVDVRIVATTNRDLQKEVEAGNFREDLYYRLNVIEMGLPPLRERKEDIPALVQNFVAKYNDENGKSVEGVADDALDALMQYDWPGNIRELENYTERAVVVAQGQALKPGDYPQRLTSGPQGRDDGGIHVGMTVHEMERRLIMKTLESCEGNRTEAASKLAISTRTLRNKLHEYGEMKAFKESDGNLEEEVEETLVAAMA